MSERPSFGVVIPTFRRPDWIRRAHGSLLAQSEPPTRIVIVARDSDEATLDVVRGLAESDAGRTTFETVDAPGHIPPVKAGSEALLGAVDLIAWLDDDAEAHEDWAKRFRDDFLSAPRVGAVGGRVVNRTLAGELIDEGAASRFGVWDRLGRPIGNLYRSGAHGLQPADFFMAGNVCFRAVALRDVDFDMRLNRDVAFHYELDVAFQIREAGWGILYDAENTIDHYSAPRASTGMRGNPTEGLTAASRNLTRVRLKHLRGPSRVLALGFGAAIGGRRDPGWLVVGPLCVQERSVEPVRRFAACLRGRLEAYAEWRR